jgi:hypothetical protein
MRAWHWHDYGFPAQLLYIHVCAHTHIHVCAHTHTHSGLTVFHATFRDRVCLDCGNVSAATDSYEFSVLK